MDGDLYKIYLQYLQSKGISGTAAISILANLGFPSTLSELFKLDTGFADWYRFNNSNNPNNPNYSFGVLPPGTGSNNTNTNSWQNALDSLGAGNGDAQALFDLLSGYQGSGTSTERNDMIYQFLLSLISTQGQRNYDWNLLQNNRQYNDPTNMLARYMGAGISRDAAIQAMQGSAGNVASGGGSGSSAGMPSVPAPSGTAANNTANTIINGINALSSLVNSGVSIAQGIAQIQSIKNQNYLTTQQINAYKSNDQVLQQIQLLQSQGVINYDSISSANDLDTYLKSMAKDNAQVAQLIASPDYQNVHGTHFGRKIFNESWKDIRNTRDEGKLLDEFIQNQHLENALLSIQTDKVGAEISNIGKQNDLIDQQILESTARIAQIDAEIRVKDAEGKWITKQTSRYDELVDAQTYQLTSQAYNLDLQSEGQQVQNSMLSMQYQLNEAGFPILKEFRIHQLRDELDHWRLLRDPDVRAKRMSAWLLEADNAQDMAYFKNIYLNAAGGFAERHPSLWGLLQAFNGTGLFDMVDSASGAAVAGSAVKNAATNASKLGTAARVLPLGL